MKRHLAHWQDIASIVVGIWLMASPWVLGVDVHTSQTAFGNFIVIGAVLLGFALSEVFIPESWEEYSELYLGCWLIASPWILGFTDVPVAKDNALACGAIVTVLAIWVLATDPEYGWFRRRLTHHA